MGSFQVSLGAVERDYGFSNVTADENFGFFVGTGRLFNE